jgi:CheY-like chemotaxis protein
VRARVLLVEDALDNQRLLALYLREAGADVQVAADGVTACEMTLGAVAAGAPFDVVLMDVQMPRLDGYHATARLRAAGYRGVVVALTAHALESERGRCLEAGCDDFLSKPVEPAVLVATIAKHVGPRPVAEPAAEGPLVSHLAGSDGLDELLREFVEALPERVAAMERDLATGDLQQLAGRTHQLKGTAGVYGFPRLTEAARELEATLKAGRPVDEIQAKLGRLGTLCRRAAWAPPDPATERRLAAASGGRPPPWTPIRTSPASARAGRTTRRAGRACSSSRTTGSSAA